MTAAIPLQPTTGPAEVKYTAQTSLPYGPEELGAFHRFHAYDWDNDDDFQSGVRTIAQSQSQSTPSLSELLKMKQYYFSTRLNTRINLDNYLAWRKYLEQPTDDPNVPIFKRFDEYNFDNDVKFQQGLPSFIGQLIKEGKNTLDKAALQKEITKAKAFYYARFIELFDFPAYLAWKEMEKSQAAPACPYAHLWQNKGKGTGNDLSEDSKKFLTTTPPISTGALQLHIHSPATQNQLTGVRLAKISQALAEVKEKKSMTSVFWTANTGESTRENRDPESEIVTKDEKWFSGGVVGSGITSEGESAANKELLRQYYSLVDQVTTLSNKHEKPVISVIDGMVFLSAAYLAFGTGGQRVITENATLAFTPLQQSNMQSSEHQVNNAFAGLYLLAQIQSAAESGAKPLPKGVGHYLAFCPDYILRGPDLKKLGLADFFISSTKKKDIEESVLSVAGCPPPHTTQAVRMTLNAEIVYPGPAKIDEATSVEEIISNLEKYSNNWSKSIREYIASLDPLLAKLIFRGILDASKLESFQEIARLEYRLGQHYSEYLASGKNEADGKDMSNIEAFFVPFEEEERELFTFPFAEWLQTHQYDDNGDDNLFESTSTKADASALSLSLSASTVPSDHPKIPGVDFSDPEAIKSCPLLASKATEDKAGSTSTASAPPNTPPTDHPAIPGVDFSDPEAIKACPFLSAKKKEEVKKEEVNIVPVATVPTANGTMPSDHPKIPGVDFSNPEAIKFCPFLAAKARD
ncbi:hypothetical protein BG004_007666 [Podila humilis]|nr:hypothetical protein BG004_007666 [Podila humilis]